MKFVTIFAYGLAAILDFAAALVWWGNPIHCTLFFVGGVFFLLAAVSARFKSDAA